MKLGLISTLLGLLAYCHGKAILPKIGLKSKIACVISVRDLMVEPQPLYLIPDGDWWPINGKGQMIVAQNEGIMFYCPSKFEEHFKGNTSVIAKCVDETTFKVGTTKYDFSDFKCKSWPSYIARKTGAPCPGGVYVKTGFEMGERFLNLSLICFNETLETTRFVYHTLEPGTDYYQANIPRVGFTKSGFFGKKNVLNLYSQNQQQITISKTLQYNASNYFDEKSFYLAKGHLAAKTDFILGSLQRGTFLFVNAVPQWQTFNAGNWQRVEDGIRTMVTKRQIHVDCYTGTNGITTLPNRDGIPTDLYLYDDDGIQQIPVPKLFYRIIHEPLTGNATVLIGVNNPYLTLQEIEDDYIICPDISEDITFVNWSKDNITKGYSYACEYHSFKKVIPYIPKLNVTGIFL